MQARGHRQGIRRKQEADSAEGRGDKELRSTQLTDVGPDAGFG